MAIDRKYGRVELERGDIGEDEPVVVFRAQDALLTLVLNDYRLLCVHNGSSQAHLDGIDQTIEDVKAWQRGHFTQVPQSDPATRKEG